MFILSERQRRCPRGQRRPQHPLPLRQRKSL
jgi:hypothetical protein